MGVEEGVIAATLIRLLSQFAWTEGIGRVVSEILFLLNPETEASAPT